MAEPASLNPFSLVAGPTVFSVLSIHNLALASALEAMPDYSYRPGLLARRPIVTRRPFSVTYTLRHGVRWSDGRPLTVRDLVFTWQTFKEARHAVQSLGYEDITRARVRSRRTVTFFFARRYAAYRALFQTVLPHHALAGEDLTAFWRNGVDNPKTGRPIGSGPFLLQSWQRGVQMVFVRNPNYWGKRPYLQRLVVRFGFPLAQAEALRRREIDVATLPAAEAMPALVAARHVRIRALFFPGFDHLVFNMRPGTDGHALLRRRFVRLAIAHGLDRAALQRSFNRELAGGTLLPGVRRAKPLQSFLIYPGSRYYQPHWTRYRHDRALAQRLLRRNGCRRGPDGVGNCDGSRLSFRVTTTAGHLGRQRVFDVMRAQLRRIGIELTADFVPFPFREKLPRGEYDLALFGFSGGAEPNGSPLFGCGGAQNWSGYCDRRVTRLFDAATRELERRRQAQLVNRGLAEMARDLPVLPLYQPPGYIAHARALRGLQDNPAAVPTWGARRWWLARR